MGKNNPKISIITICYNSEIYLEQAIKSIVNQPYLNKEYIIIDGGSTDGTLDIISRYRDQIDYFVSEPDKGISDAFNKGIKAATGDIIGIINSDDMLADNALQSLADNYDPKVDIYRGICRHIDSESGSVFDEKPTLYFPAIPMGLNIAHPATFVSKSAYDRFGIFDTSLKYAMDLDLLRRFSKADANVKYVDQVLAVFRLGGCSQQYVKERSNEVFRIMRKNGSNGFQVFIFAIYYKIRCWLRALMIQVGGANALLVIKNRVFK